MYDLNYTFLTDLEVDTRQTFADISSDLILLGYQSGSTTGLKKSNMKTVISSWQNYFWNTDDEENIRIKQNLNVIFTDLLIDHKWIDNKDDLNGKEMLSIDELNEFFDGLDNDGEGHGRWCGKWTYTELCSQLSSAINTLHNKFADNKNVYPISSIVITKGNPNQNGGFGQWAEVERASYLSERIMNSDINLGYNPGKVNGSSVNSDLRRLVLTPPATNSTSIPKHEHKLTFSPASASKKGDDGPTELDGDYVKVTKNYRPGCNKTSNTCAYTGQDTRPEKNTAQSLALAADYHDTRSAEHELEPEFSVSPASANPKQSNITVAPKTYPIDASVWERTS